MKLYLLAEVPNYPIYIGAALLVTVISAVIFKMVFAVDRRLKLMEAQTKLLREIALKVGATEQEISYILNKVNL